MTDKEIVLLSIREVKQSGLILNKHMSVDTFLEKIIFSHDFAKALWGERINSPTIIDHEDGYPPITYMNYDPHSGWQYHLQQMVLEEKPLQYLERFV